MLRADSAISPALAACFYGKHANMQKQTALCFQFQSDLQVILQAILVPSHAYIAPVILPALSEHKMNATGEH